jgi:hypothetical protein
LFVAVKNSLTEAPEDSALHFAMGGSAKLPLVDVKANRAKILRQTAYYFLATGFDVSIDTIVGPAVPAPGFIPNHIGVSLP